MTTPQQTPTGSPLKVHHLRPAPGAKKGSYVPPALRGDRAGAAGERMGGKFGDRDDLATLRVTNVSEFAEEQDLRDMFSRYGHVTRVFLAKDRETGRAKGFAFISYADRSDAAKACEKMDGCKWRDWGCVRWGRFANIRQLVSITLSCASSSPRRLKRLCQVASCLQAPAMFCAIQEASELTPQKS